MFNGFYITFAEETMLGGNQFKKDSKRFSWKESNDNKNTKPSETYAEHAVVDIENVTLQPMQIRTLILSIKNYS